MLAGALTKAVQPNASVASTGLGIRYIGEHCYAYSGMHNVASNNVEHLSFISGSGVIVGTISCMGSVDTANSALGGVTAFTIAYNGVITFKIKTDTEAEDMPSVQTVPIIIPPFTVVEVNADSNNADVGLETSATITGRVYGAE